MEEEINGISEEYSSHKLIAISSQFVDDKKSLISYILILDWITICLFSTCLLPVKLTLKDNDCCEGHFVDVFETFKHSLKKVEVIIMTNNKSVHSNVISEILLLLLLIFSSPTLFRPSAAK